MAFFGGVWSHIRMQKLTKCWTQCNPFCMNKSSQIKIRILLAVNMRECTNVYTYNVLRAYDSKSD